MVHEYYTHPRSLAYQYNRQQHVTMNLYRCILIYCEIIQHLIHHSILNILIDLCGAVLYINMLTIARISVQLYLNICELYIWARRYIALTTRC
jgi:hypothetical protein